MTLGGFHTLTITKKYIFIGCEKFTIKQVKNIKRKDAIKHGLPTKIADQYKKTINAAIKLFEVNNEQN